MRVTLQGIRVPELARISSERWPQVLIPLAEALRTEAVLDRRIDTESAFALLRRLPPPPSELAWRAARAGQSVPVPEAPRPAKSRQVNVRLQPHEHESLQRAAAVLGARPSQVVRMLVVNGVRRVLAEHDAAIASAGG